MFAQSSTIIDVERSQDSKKQKISTKLEQHGADSSFKVITSIANSMVGSGIIVFPILFIKNGMLGSLIVLLVIGVTLYFTCRVLVLHNRDDESDFSHSIRRILGNKWARFNSIVNITLLFMVSLAFFMLICDNFFDITSAIFTESIKGYTPPSGKGINLSKYSPQYACIICMLFTAPFICKRDIEFLMKFLKFTIYLVFAYGVFIFFALIKVLANGELNFSEQFNLFNPDFSTVAGTFALSFLVHPTAAPMLKRNIKQENNMRDLLLGYGLTALIYVFVGFFGALTCATSANAIQDSNDYSTIFDCFPKGTTRMDNVFFAYGKAIQFGIFVQNLSVMTFLSYCTRKEFLDQFESQENRNKLFYAYNVVIIILCLILTFFEVDVTIVMSLNGAIVGFFIAYAIPIATHLACNHRILPHDQKKEGANPQGESTQKTIKCNEHSKSPLMRNILVYGGLLAMGISISIFKLYSLAKSK